MIKRNYSLAQNTTFRIGGVADVFSQPECEEVLFGEIANCRSAGTPVRVLGRGSNVLISDKRIHGCVINLEECCGELKIDRDGLVYAGAGVPLSRFIMRCIDADLYGNEYLSSVPGSIGGAVYMNAGTWTDYDLYISDYLESVRVFDGTAVFSVAKDQCQFGYRTSVFQQRPEWVILGATFHLPKQASAVGKEKRQQRLSWSREHQDVRYGNAGSIFRQLNGHIMGVIMGLRVGKAGWSPKTGNWINNYGGASFSNVSLMVRIAEMLSCCVGTRPSREIVTWRS